MHNVGIKLGISPINWVNEDVLELGDHYTCEELLADFAALGFTATENCRKFPKDPEILRPLLAEKGIQMSSQWKGVLFSDPAYRESELEAYRKHVEFLQKMGSQHVVTCELGGSIIGDPRRAHGEKTVVPLTDEEWNQMVEGLHLAGEICREHGMKLVYHYHIGTVVERPEEIDRLMETTDPALVHLLFDSGHAYYGGSNPLMLLKKYADRIAYVHLKDVRQPVLDRITTEGISFQTAVIQGVFTVPGDGCIDFEPIFQELLVMSYDGWMIIEAEQDPSVADPFDYANKSKAYIYDLVSKLKGDLSRVDLIVPSRKQPDEQGSLLTITPASAGWTYVGFEVISLAQGQTLKKETQDMEICLVLLSGRVDVSTSALKLKNIGQRMSVFEQIPPYSVYIPSGDYYEITAQTKLELAICSAPGKGTYPARLIAPGDVGIETRGYGNIERRIHNILPSQEAADSLLVVEVFTPNGHWSSYPPHKHDQDNLPHESYLEETYYHKIKPETGFAIQRVYTLDGSLDETMIVKDGDAVLVPKGFHPVSAPPGYDVYYLNVMAGPVRVWQFYNDPAHEWLMTQGKK